MFGSILQDTVFFLNEVFVLAMDRGEERNLKLVSDDIIFPWFPAAKASIVFTTDY